MSRSLSVVVVDDHELFRQGVVAAIDHCCTVVAEADDVDTAVAAIAEHRPQVVLLDVHLPSGSGADVIARVGEVGHQVEYLALSVSDAPEDVIGVVLGGARGYVTKRIGAEELCQALHHVADGNAVFSPRLAGFVLDAYRAGVSGQAPTATSWQNPPNSQTPNSNTPNSKAGQPPPDSQALDTLTRREREVMEYLARGYSYKEIAAELFISDRTVESHASAVLRKLQLSNRNELAHWASSRRLL